MTDIAITFDLKSIHQDNISKHLHASLHAAIARSDAVLKASCVLPKGKQWQDTFHKSSSINLSGNAALFTIDCHPDVADMILVELLKDSSYRLLRGPYSDGTSHLCKADLP